MGGGLDQMVGQVQQVLGTLGSLRQLVDLGSAVTNTPALAQAFGGSTTVPAPTPATAQPSPAAQATQAEPAALFASSLVDMLQRTGQSGAKLEDTVSRLSEFIPQQQQQQQPPQLAADTLESSPAFKRLRAENSQLRSDVTNIQNTVNAQGGRLGDLEGSVRQVAQNTDGMKGQLEQVLALLARPGTAPSLPETAGGSAPPPGAVPPSPRVPEVGGLEDPLLKPMVDLVQFTALLPIIGVSPSRLEAKNLNARLTSGPLPFEAVWETMGKWKTLAGWQRKLNALAESDNMSDAYSLRQIGETLYCRIKQDLTLAPADRQPALSPSIGSAA